MVDALILAAGAGRRMGGRPKALLELEGRSFLERVARVSREAGCRTLWAVVPPPPTPVTEAAATLGISVLPNPRPEDGMFTSVRIGLESVLETDPPDGILVFPVDHPRVATGTVRRLIQEIQGKPEGVWLQPGYQTRGGHPILVDGRTASTLLAQNPDLTLREALRSGGSCRILVPVDDPGILRNINRPSDLDEPSRPS